MRKSRMIVAGLTVVLVAGLTGLAGAHTVQYPTSLTIHVNPDPPVDRGTMVVFSGRLKSERVACLKNSTVKLVKVGVGVVNTTQTNSEGRYRFEKRLVATNSWKVRFSGKVLTAVHPHNHTCSASTSDTVKVRVV